MKCLEQLREMYWEALRAPAENATFNRNPYRREQITKKFLGKTKAERVAKMKEVNAAFRDHVRDTDAKLM